MVQNEIPLGDLDEVNKSIKMVNMIVKLDVPIIKIVPLTNLRDLSITLDGLTGEDPDDELPSTLVEFIQGASNIESLSLAFEEDEERGAPPWGSIDLFSKLGSDCFPNLRILETKSLYLAPIDNYSGPEFRQFIRSSNKLQKIILSTDGYDSTPGLLYPPGLILTPTDMEEMMPSIRHFGGLGNVLQDLDNFVLDEMPNLRGLGYFNGYEEGDEWGAIANLLSKLATKLPALEELILVQFNWPEHNQLDRLLEAIQPLPRLRRLAISLWHSKISTREFVDNIQHFYERIGAPCPEVNVDIINPNTPLQRFGNWKQNVPQSSMKCGGTSFHFKSFAPVPAPFGILDIPDSASKSSEAEVAFGSYESLMGLARSGSRMTMELFSRVLIWIGRIGANGAGVGSGGPRGLLVLSLSEVNQRKRYTVRNCTATETEPGRVRKESSKEPQLRTDQNFGKSEIEIISVDDYHHTPTYLVSASRPVSTMPLPQVPPELKPIAPFLQRADEMRAKDPIISFWCEYYAVKKGLSLKLSGGGGRQFLAKLMDSLEATKKALRDHESIQNEEVAYLYVENFADRIFVMADEEDRRGAASRSTAKKFLAAGQFYDLLGAFDNVKLSHTPKTIEKRTYSKWRATEISKAFRDGRAPPPPPSPSAPVDSQLPSSLTDPSASIALFSPPTAHTHNRSQSSQSPSTATTSSLITSVNGSGFGNGNGTGSTSRRRASDVSTTTPTRSAGGSSPLWSNRVYSPPDAPGRDGNPPSVIESPIKEKHEEDSETDLGTDEDGNGGHLRGDARRSRFNSTENGHEASGESVVGSNGVWDNRQASLAVQPPESRQASFAQRPSDSAIHGQGPTSPTAASLPVINGPPTLIPGTANTDSTHLPNRRHPSPSASTATPASSHASIPPASSPAPKTDSPTESTSTPTGSPAGANALATALVLPPRRVHFSGSTVGGLSSVASSSPDPTNSRRYEPTPRAPPAILPPPDVDALPPLTGALVRPQAYQINRAIPNVAYPTASAPPYPEPTYVAPPALVQPHPHGHHHSPSQSHSHSPSQTHALVQVPQQSSYPYTPATPHAKPASPPLPTAISGPSTQRAQKHAKFAISALDYDDLETARRELLNALAIVNGRAT
ncbi:hypothetical protein RHS01_05608 [Rhizoctonia solani]|uniref:Uncharacterized protein n=1 Tax=Rhizoctonia solani TaxID=456999 RepID=A0A8H7IAX3_9AGAM|nr:hypothetical protein RHS01_05608 [Rhizoctonia solani]